ncbi:unnamed protein product [marine sediment metagenome]|uniref:Uncharacterized protein n=1 Tax=marine sediment metagenome TaxID=412755 RepID=X1MUS5_9ZZZZ
MPAPGGTANWIKAYLNVANSTKDIKAFINQKDSVAAGQHGQIAVKENLANPIALGWITFTLAGEALTSGVDYILNIHPETGEKTTAYYDTIGALAIASYYDNSETYCSESNPWVIDPEGTTKDWSIYCDYTALVPGWTGTISGVVNPAEIAGVPVANIASVKGVA